MECTTVVDESREEEVVVYVRKKRKPRDKHKALNNVTPNISATIR